MEFLKSHDEVSLTEIAGYLQISRNTVSRKINMLVASGRVIRVGQTRSTKVKLFD